MSMTAVFIVRRLLQSAGVLAVMSLLVFVGVYAIGDPAEMLISPEATQMEREQAMRALGLDQPLWMQYAVFVSGLFNGNFGKSFVFGTPALQLILEKMPATIELASCALLFALLLGLPLGIYAGLRHNSVLGRSIMAGSILTFSLPTFWIGLLLIMVFAVKLGWLPSTGRGETVVLFGIKTSLATWDGIAHLILPATNLALFKVALVIRLTYAGVRENMLMDYVRFARAKGLPMRRIVGVHVLKNILIPIVTVVAMEFGSLVAFSVVTETIFAWPGMGKLIIDSINLLDRPVIVAYLLIIVTMFVFLNLAADIFYSVIDPRVRFQRAA